MQHHIHLGYDLIKNKRFSPRVINVMIMHHERCDGTGYPARLKADRIDPYAMLAAITDTLMKPYDTSTCAASGSHTFPGNSKLRRNRASRNMELITRRKF